MIQSFADKRAERLFHREQNHKHLPTELQRVARRKLIMLHRATRLEDLRVPPNNRLEKLKGDRKGRHSIRINEQWRVCFTWHSGHAYQVEIIDYHKG